MPIDVGGLPIGGPLLVVAAGYAALSLLVTGPTISKRVIERGGWVQQCQRSIIHAVKRDVPELQAAPPNINCNKIVGLFSGGYSRDGDAFCNAAGFLFENPVAKQIEDQNRRLRENHNRRVASIAASATSRCACSASIVSQDRVPWAIYAGSLRLTKMSEIDNLDARLNAALSSAVCVAKIDGRSK